MSNMYQGPHGATIQQSNDAARIEALKCGITHGYCWKFLRDENRRLYRCDVRIVPGGEGCPEHNDEMMRRREY